MRLLSEEMVERRGRFPTYKEAAADVDSSVKSTPKPVMSQFIKVHKTDAVTKLHYRFNKV